MLIGGEVNRDTGGIYGPWTAKQLEGLDFRLQKTFLGVDGINILEGNKISITIGNLSEIEQKKKLIEMSNKIYILLDSTKLNGGGQAIIEGDINSPELKNIKFILSYQNKEKDEIKKIEKVLGNKITTIIYK